MDSWCMFLASSAAPALAVRRPNPGVCERNYDFPQEMAHFVDCVLSDKQPLVTGEDGRVVMGIICAAYESAGTGKRVGWPYKLPRDKTPQQVWGR